MGKGVTVRDVLLAILIIAIVGAGVGAVLGFSQNRFGLSQPVRVAIIAASTGATAPVAAPATRPQRTYRCHGSDARVVSTAAAAIMASATVTTRRITKT